MKIIQVTSFLSTELISDFSFVKTIEIEDKPIAEGAFGEVYLCVSINQLKPSIPQVIKIFKEDSNNQQDHNVETVEKLQKKLKKKNKELINQNQGNLIEKYPALKGVPQLSYVGVLNGKTVRGFSSTNLKKIGFEEFIDILEDDKLRNSYQALGIDKKMLIAYRLVSAFKLLNEIYFIHADLKPEALFINTSNDECAIIDFDSGTVTENVNDEPNTWGAPNDWVAPEIWEQLKLQTTNGLQKVKVNLLSDLWSVSVGIHYILTTTHPLFYLNELSPRTAKQYFFKYKWPTIDTTENYFNRNNETIYLPISNWLNNILPKAIFHELSNTINYGYNNPTKRTTYNEWEKVLLSVQEPPKINTFDADREIVIDGVPVNLSWNVTDYFQLNLNDGKNDIDVTNTNNIDLKPNVNTNYKLIAKSHFGFIESNLIEIRVFPVPKILTIGVPTPHFNHELNLNNINITSPNVNIGVSLNNNLFKTEVVVFSELKKTKSLLKTSHYKNNTIHQVFDEIQNIIKSKLLNKFYNENNK